MWKFLLQRLGFAAASVWGVVTLVFFLTKLIPGNAARIAAGPDATEQQVQAAARSLDLDKPVLVQYADFLGRAVRGNLGVSAATHQTVVHDLLLTVPVTIQLVIAAMILTAVIAVPVGVLAAVYHGRAFDLFSRFALVTCGGVPVFLIAILLQWGVASQLRWLPISGANKLGLAPPPVTGMTVIDSLLAGSGASLADSLAHLVLPALALCVPFVVVLARNVRSTMISALATDYADFATAKGASPARVVVRHALRASMSSTITIFGMQLSWMIGSALLVETVFAMPGLGTYLNNAVLDQDTFAVLGSVIVVGVIGAATSFAVDVIHYATDPRVRRSYELGGA